MMNFEELKENFCARITLKWKRFLRATDKPTVRTKADLSISVCGEEEGNQVDVLNGNLDSKVPLRDLVATVAAISLLCSLLRAIFGRR